MKIATLIENFRKAEPDQPRMGEWIFKSVQEIGDIAIFFGESVKSIFSKPFRYEEIVKQLEFVGNKSVFIICLTGLSTGVVFSYQAWIGFSIVNAENLVGPTAALAITRELGPVLTGLIIAARAGGAMAAHLGSMKVSEQIDALKVMAVNPIQYLVSPRVIASIVGTPLLIAVFDFVAMIGSYILCTRIVGIDEGIFWAKIQLWLNPKDIMEGLLKGVVFGGFYAAICCYRGYHVTGGAKGVGEATNRGVVASMVSIILVDYFITKMFRLMMGMSK